MTRRTKLTDRLVGSLATRTTSGRTQIRDSQLPGLVLEISSRHKRFIVRYKGLYKTIGEWPKVCVREAREVAFDFIRSIEGVPINPYRTQQEAPSATLPLALPTPIAPAMPVRGMTLKGILDEYIAAKKLKPRTKDDYRQCLTKFWPDYLGKPLEFINGDTFLERFREIQAPSAANYSLRIIRALFRFYNAAHDAALPIPTAKTLAIEGVRELRPKSRLILDSQQQAWIQAVKTKAGPTGRTLFTLLALSGLRIGEALSLTWADIDQATGLLSLRDTKNRKPHVLPLGRHLRALIESQRQAPALPVFKINERNVRKATYKVIDECGVEWSAHDLRRGFVSIAVRLGISDRLVKRLVNHSEQDVTGRHYIHISPDALRPHMQTIEDAIRSL